MDVPLEASALLVLRGDQALSRFLKLDEPSPEVRGETDVSKTPPRLGSQVSQKMPLGRPDVLSSLLRERKRPQQLAAVSDRLDQGGVTQKRHLVAALQG